MNTHQANRYTQFITPLGGIIALTCFFFPWLTMVTNFSNARSNFQLAQSGFQLFVLNPLGPHTVFSTAVFMASVVIVGVSLYMVIHRTPWKSSVPVLISSGIGLAILFAEQRKYTRISQYLEHSNYAIELGSWGTAAGLAIAAFGILLLRTEKEKAHSKDSVEVKRLWFIVHAGGIIALLGIFMPWELFSLTGPSSFSLMNPESFIRFVFIASVIVLLLRTKIGKAHSKDSVEVKRLWFIVHAGGIIALLGIFMPWDDLSSLTHYSGFSLMNRRPLIRFAFVASVIVLMGSFYMLASENLRRLRVVVLVSIGIGLGILLAYYVDFYVIEIHTQNILRKSDAEWPGRFMGFGFWGTILGYVIAAVGMLLISIKNKNEQVAVTAE